VADDALPTRIVHAGDAAHRAPSLTWPVAPPIVQTSVYAYPDIAAVDAVHDGVAPGYIYGRYGVPNHVALEVALAELEGAEAALATTSGTSAIASTLFALLEMGDRVVAASNIYGGTRGLLNNELRRFGVHVSYAHPADRAALMSALATQPPPKLVWVDSLANPTLLASDIPMLAELAHAAGALLVVDNTFATPLHCQPLTLGADLVLHSATKFIGGHNDTSAGAVLGAPERVEAIRRVAIRLGAIGAPFEAWLALRGLRTLDVRLRRSSATALALAEALEGHPAVRRVHYPGLGSDPGHEVALRTLRNGFGSMLSVDFGAAVSARRVIDGLRLIAVAETLGGLMTTVVHPRSASYRTLTLEQLAEIGVSEGLVRFSIGIEAPEDLLADIAHALDAS
jgi:cystathionine beta-lyase/cystathionine gamma-synthase